MQTSIRYYITCDDDRPVVRTIPVSLRPINPTAESPAAGAAPGASVPKSTHNQAQSSARMKRLVRAAVAARRDRDAG